LPPVGDGDQVLRICIDESRRSGKLFMPDIHTHQNVGQRKAVARPTGLPQFDLKRSLKTLDSPYRNV